MRQKVEARKEALSVMLDQVGRLTVDEIVRHFEISQPTARRLCSALAADGKAMRIHGGICGLAAPSSYSFEALQKEAHEEKARIASYAAQLVEDGNAIFLEAGTTIMQFAIALARRLRDGELPNVLVFTNSLYTLEILKPFTKVMMTGGLYRKARCDLTGYLAERMIRGLRFDQCFIGADAVSTSDGIMASDIDTVRFDELLVSRSERTYVLAHSKKFARHSLISITPLQNVHMIITDTELSDQALLEYEAEKSKIVRV